MNPAIIGDATVYLGDCLDVLKTLPDRSVDSIVTDPPYHLTSNSGGPTGAGADSPHARAKAGASRGGFMGQAWDGGDIAFRAEVWVECLRVLKPGGHLLAFSGTRTYHRMACAIEDAGFEIRDQIGWLYGSGFPKSRNLDGDWDGWGTALKPAWEPIAFARRPLAGTVAANVLQFGTGALNIDGCRIPVLDADYVRNCSGDRGHADNRKREMEFGLTAGSAHASGRWPANVIHDGSDEVLEVFPQAMGQQGRARTDGAIQGNNTFGALRHITKHPEPRKDAGTAARFFYCAKASRQDRNEGCEHMDKKPLNWSSGKQNPGSFQSEGADKSAQNNHPTVKPTDLMSYLCRLVTPPGGTVLDPFMGSGSTGKAAVREGFRFIGIDMTPEYVEIALARIAHEHAKVEVQRATEATASDQRDLFEENAA